MVQITLGTSGRRTTRLGYGCSSLMGAMSRRQSLAVLEAAYDAGIRHFDVAPMYGYGTAEACVGEFFKRHPADITITTKYGIPPASNRSFLSLARSLAGPVIKALPDLKQKLIRTANTVAQTHRKDSFTADKARASLEQSLIHLQTDHIDLWLMHEAEAADLHDDKLLRLLEDEVAAGTIGSFGVGSEAASIPALLADRPLYCRTLQFEWSILDAPIPASASFRIHHRALTNNLASVHSALTRDATLCQRWSSHVQADLSQKPTLAALMLKASLLINPQSIVLFSSKDPKHMQQNVQNATDKTLDASALRLYDLVQHNGLNTGHALVL